MSGEPPQLAARVGACALVVRCRGAILVLLTVQTFNEAKLTLGVAGVERAVVAATLGVNVAAERAMAQHG